MRYFFEILFVVGNRRRFPRGSAFLRGNLSCCISRTEGRRKVKLGEVSRYSDLSILFWEKIEQKICDLNALLNIYKYQKTIRSLASAVQKIDFGGPLERFSRGGTLKLLQSICLLNIN